MNLDFNYNDDNKKIIIDSYNANGYVVLENFIDINQANDLYNFLETRPEFWWESSTVNDESWNGPNNVPYFDENKDIIDKNKLKARVKFIEGNFAYDFDRLREDHVSGCECFTCKFTKDVLQSKKLLDICKDITNNNELGQVPLKPFYSRYSSGNFLSCHTDTANSTQSQEKRRLAVVLHMTKNWQPWYGGNLVIMNKESNEIKKVQTPKFNSLCLMKVEEEGMPHYVDQIFDSLSNKRYAISMWY